VKKPFLERLKKEIIIFDGAMGTELPANLGRCPEELNLTHPGVIAGVHTSYVKAGADVITTNTFGGNRFKLKENGLADKIEEINTKGVELARQSAGRKALVAASVGPTGKLLEPLGKFTFEDFYEIYRQQIKILAQAGPDIIILETMFDIQEAKIALIAAKETCKLPVVCSLTFNEKGTMITGSNPLIALAILEPLQPAAVGANCSLGPKGLLKVMREFASATNLPLIVQPNAGLPKMVKGRTVYPASGNYMAKYALDFVKAGVNIVGSCCGSGPEHTKAIIGKIKNKRPRDRKIPTKTYLASRTKVVFFTGAPVVVGERINPTGKKNFQLELRKEKFSFVATEAKKQAAEGAQVVDVNVNGEGISEARAIRKAILTIEKTTDLPLAIDSGRPEVIEKALQSACGKVLINSVNGKTKSLRAILPLAKRFGAAIIGLTLDEKGIPTTARQRLLIAERIVREAVKVGIAKENIFIDTLTLTVASQPDQVAESLEALRLVKRKLGVKTILGISNISFGLPNRPLLNSTFYHMARGYGLDAAIMNPRDSKYKRSSLALEVLQNKDRGARRYIELQRGPAEKKVRSEPDIDVRVQLREAVIGGNKEGIFLIIEKVLEDGYQPLEIIEEFLTPAITLVGERYQEGVYFLPQLISSAEAMKLACEALTKKWKGKALSLRKKIVIATVEGDIHDIGKNIVSLLLSNHGFEVIDLGKDVKGDEIIRQALSEKADLIGLSSLMTTTRDRIKEIIDGLKKRKINIPTLIGGAVITNQYARGLGSSYAKDAIEAVKKAKELVKPASGRRKKKRRVRIRGQK
jgi:5-methyltetrahydrofolate--homocysteine methyltransferase